MLFQLETLYLDVPNFYYEESSDDDSDNSEYDSSETTNDLLQNTHIIKLMHHIIYNSLFDYWNKLLIVATSNCKQTTTSIYTTSNDSNIRYNHFHFSIFGISTSIYTAFNPLAKLKCYLDPTQTPISNDNVNPFE
ncbi:1787_t:CDS:2 [Cetraspora pellucida]|uniref:1787_t:CDS:1 n=1 Tax=Cetraspora pellucida TaxID=1433469 RepID=A0A9N9AHN0_9GLOM|nr:1787_t:CDS:2 [Cetraspora pellucida]